jgi:DNA-binding Lrp family transcriptional regulator
MSEQDRDEYDREQKQDAKVWMSVRELAKRANASEEGINSALDELQAGGMIDTDRPKSGPRHRGNKRYYFRLHQPSVNPSKKKMP